MVNIYDVAKKANISIATVSNVINRKDKEVSEKVRKEVLKAIGELGYIHNKVASHLASGKTRSIGVVVSDITNPSFTEIIREIEDCAYKKKFNIHLAITRHNLDRAKVLIKDLIGFNVTGIMLLNKEVDTEVVKILKVKKISTVLYGWDIVDDYICNIKINFKKGISEAIKHLYEFNHRKVLFTPVNKNFKVYKDRKREFIESVKELNLRDFEYKIVEGDDIDEGNWEVLKKVLSDRYFKPTAIMCANDINAFKVLFSLAENNVRVPEDISLIGTDNIQLSSIVVPKLTTINLSNKELGKKIIRMLFNLINSDDKKGFEETIETELIIRNSTKKIINLRE